MALNGGEHNGRYRLAGVIEPILFHTGYSVSNGGKIGYSGIPLSLDHIYC